jgi:RNA polymerase sigma-70 factor (ECF subfamily)
MNPSTRHSLVLRLRDAGDQLAWAEFVDIYEPVIYRLARKWGLQDADAHDLCQEVFRGVAKSIERWDPDPAKGRFRSWLFRIARNRVVDSLAAQRRHARGTGRTSVQEMLEAHPANGELDLREFNTELKRRVFRWAAERIQAEFAANTWKAFWRTGVENRPVASVAKELGMSEGAVYIARSRVLARLRQRVQEVTDDAWEAPAGDADRATKSV